MIPITVWTHYSNGVQWMFGDQTDTLNDCVLIWAPCADQTVIEQLIKREVI